MMLIGLWFRYLSYITPNKVWQYFRTQLQVRFSLKTNRNTDKAFRKSYLRFEMIIFFFLKNIFYLFKSFQVIFIH